MQHLNPYRFYELAARLHCLFGCANQPRVSDLFGPLAETQAALDGLIKGDPIPLETSKGDATRLLNKISSVFDRYFIDPSSHQIRKPEGEDRIDSHEIATIQSLMEKFEHALAAELNYAPTYYASKRGIYSTYDLIENAYQTFSPSVLKTVPVAAQSEFGTAGRALAFGLGTAAAMHLLRAVEIVLKQYFELFSGTTAAKAERSYNIYLKKLAAMADDDSSTARPDKRLLQMLAQIKEHYRTPLSSPENNVTIEQSTSLFGLATAIITMMAEQIAAKQKPTNGKNGKGAKASKAIDDEAETGDDDDDYAFPVTKAG
jgi:hypothetical protein